MNEEFSGILNRACSEIRNAESTPVLNDMRVRYLGKTGEVTMLMRNMKSILPENRAEYGKSVNDLKTAVEAEIETVEHKLKENEMQKKFAAEAVDVTESGIIPQTGGLHPVNIVKERITDIFTGLGFDVFEGPEIELDYYCFQALNIPKDHPARDMQDTFYVNDNVVLRSHTSPGQVRVMENGKPPIKVLSPGRVYRSDDDASHSPMFHQIEGLVVDKDVNMCDLQGLLNEFVRKMFDSDTKTRFRPSYFPFTEPSVEVDVTCCKCHGKGCPLCKGTGWIEILGAGVVNKFVLDNSGIDSEKYSGLAFGFGLERITMIKYGISDIRTLFESNLKFLKQFERR